MALNQMSNRRLSHASNQTSEYWRRGEEQMRDLIRDREGTAILTALAAGFGVGLVIGALLGHAHHEPRTWRERLAAEDFGRRLMDRIEGLIPEAVSSHFAK